MTLIIQPFIFAVYFMMLGVQLMVQQCTSECIPAKTLEADGDIYIIGLFTFHHEQDGANTSNRKELDAQGLLWSLAMVHTLEEYRGKYGSRYGYKLFDTCDDVRRTQKILLELILDQKYYSCSITNQDESENNNNNNNSNSNNNRCDNIMNKISTVPIVAVVSRVAIEASKVTASILSSEQIPYLAFLGLDDHKVIFDTGIYKFFENIQTIAPTEVFLIRDVILHYNWTNIAIIYSDDSMGRNAFHLLWETLSKEKLCLLTKTFQPNNSSSIQKTVKVLGSQSAPSIIILWTGMGQAKLFLQEAEKQKLYHRTWIANTAWSTMTLFFQTLNQKVIQGLIQSSGTLRITEVQHGFWTYFYERTIRTANNNTWLAEFFEFAINATTTTTPPTIAAAASATTTPLPKTTTTTTTHSPTTVKLSDFAIYFDTDEAKYATHTLRKLLDGVNIVMRYASSFHETSYPKEKYLELLRIVAFHKYTHLKDSYPFVSILLNSTFTKITILYWPNDKSFKDKVKWAGAKENTGPPISVCENPRCLPGFHPVMGVWENMGAWELNKCWQCQRCQPGLVSVRGNRCEKCKKGTILNKNQTMCQTYRLQYHDDDQSVESILVFILMSIGAFSILVSFAIVIKYRTTPVIRSLNFPVTMIQFIAYSVLFASPQLWRVQPNQTVCVLQPVLPAFCYTLILGTMLTKTRKYLFIFKARHRVSKQEVILSTATEWLIVLVLLVIGGFILTIGFLVYPPMALRKKFPDQLMEIVYCTTTPHFHAVILFCLLLSMIILAQAYQARKLPSNFSDTRSIAFAMFTSMMIMFALVPIQLGRSLEHRLPFVCILLILLPNMATLGLLFGYKFYVVLFRPDLNNETIHRSKIYNMMKEAVTETLEERMHQKSGESTRL